MSTLTEAIAHYCAEAKFSDLPKSTIEKAKMAIADTYGVIFSGYRQSVSDIVVQWVKNKPASGTSTVFGYQLKTSASQAALINGTMGHAIDYDDVSSPLRGHPSVVILPVVLAVAEQRKSTGEDILLAFTLGVEVMVKLSRHINPSHYLKGWHSTATLGVLGAAVAAGKLAGFDQEKMKRVLALAASMASGMRLNFGTMTKPFHVGYAARNGIEAAELIELGFTASNQIFDTAINFFRLYGDEAQRNEQTETWGKPWEVEEPGLNIKRYPCCYATHRAADAAENLVQLESIDVNQIERVDCLVPLGSTAPLIYDRPKTGLEGKFSMQYVVAAMLHDGQLKMGTFTDEQVGRKTIQDLIQKIYSQEVEEIKENRDAGDLGYVQLMVRFKDGKRLEEKVYFARGSFKNPLTKEQLYVKFSDCLQTANCSESKELFERIFKLEHVKDVQELIWQGEAK